MHYRLKVKYELLERLEELNDARSSVGGEESSDTETHTAPVNQPIRATKKTKELPHGNSDVSYPWLQQCTHHQLTNSPRLLIRAPFGNITNAVDFGDDGSYVVSILICKFYHSAGY